MPPSQPAIDSTAITIAALNEPAPVPLKLSQWVVGRTVPALCARNTSMNAQTMNTVRIEYSISATVICNLALGRSPTTAVAVRAEPRTTIATAPANWLFGENPSSASTLGPIVITSISTKPPNATSISHPTRLPTYGLSERQTHSYVAPAFWRHMFRRWNATAMNSSPIAEIASGSTVAYAAVATRLASTIET